MTEEQADEVFNLAYEKYISEAGAYRKAMDEYNYNKSFGDNKDFLKAIKYDRRLEGRFNNIIDTLHNHDKKGLKKAKNDINLVKYMRGNNISDTTPDEVSLLKKDKEELYDGYSKINAVPGVSRAVKKHSKKIDNAIEDAIKKDRKNKESWMKAHGNVGTDPNEKKPGKYLDMYKKKKESTK